MAYKYDKRIGVFGAIGEAATGFLGGLRAGKQDKMSEQEVEDRKSEREQRRLEREAERAQQKTERTEDVEWRESRAKVEDTRAADYRQLAHDKFKLELDESVLSQAEVKRKADVARQQEKMDAIPMALRGIVLGQDENAIEILNQWQPEGQKVATLTLTDDFKNPDSKFIITYENGNKRTLLARDVAAQDQKLNDMLAFQAKDLLRQGKPLNELERAALKNDLLYSYEIPALDQLNDPKLAGQFGAELRLKAMREADDVLRLHYQNMLGGMTEDASAKQLGLRLRGEARKTLAEEEWTAARDASREAVGRMKGGMGYSGLRDNTAQYGDAQTAIGVSKGKKAELDRSAALMGKPSQKRIGDIIPGRVAIGSTDGADSATDLESGDGQDAGVVGSKSSAPAAEPGAAVSDEMLDSNGDGILDMHDEDVANAAFITDNPEKFTPQEVMLAKAIMKQANKAVSATVGQRMPIGR